MVFKRNPSVRVEVVVFNGRRYRRYPDSPQPAHRRYFGRSGGFLHRDVWEFHNGPIPEGHEVHHIDEDTSNNDISNLECLPAAQHRSMEHSGKAAHAKSDEQREHLARIREQAAEWHRSDEGRAWHREHAKNSIAKTDRKAWYDAQPLVEKTCEQCGAKFMGKIAKNVLCSNACISARRNRKMREAKLSVPHECKCCGAVFYTVQTRAQFCGVQCRNKYHRERRKRERLQPVG